LIGGGAGAGAGVGVDAPLEEVTSLSPPQPVKSSIATSVAAGKKAQAIFIVFPTLSY
jgi:hypothetical protein